MAVFCCGSTERSNTRDTGCCLWSTARGPIQGSTPATPCTTRRLTVGRSTTRPSKFSSSSLVYDKTDTLWPLFGPNIAPWFNCTDDSIKAYKFTSCPIVDRITGFEENIKTQNIELKQTDHVGQKWADLKLWSAQVNLISNEHKWSVIN